MGVEVEHFNQARCQCQALSPHASQARRLSYGMHDSAQDRKDAANRHPWPGNR